MEIYANPTRTRSEADRPADRSFAFEPLPEISAETLERAKERAHQLRAQAMREMFVGAGAWLRGVAHRLAAVFSNPAARGEPCRSC